jgi:hypothetical protein
MDNARSHRNPRVKDVITQHNHLLYVVPLSKFHKFHRKLF